MRTRQRLTGMQAWIKKELCAGRKMKAPGQDMNIADIRMKEPDCYIGWMPQRKNTETCEFEEDYLSTSPSITIMPSTGRAKAVEEKRFDRYNGVHRPQEMGQTLTLQLLFSVYEPGIRLPGFVDSADRQDRIDISPENYESAILKRGIDMELILEGTQEGLFTLTDWMDECMEKLLGAGHIPGTDLFVNEASIAYSLYTDQSYVVDKRPLYYGLITVEFACYAKEAPNAEIRAILD
ncbi:MAG: hypothetical protein IJ466_07310 [Clostridia bacterium]|nr:hypothetical protein [Clostridia bacterium]